MNIAKDGLIYIKCGELIYDKFNGEKVILDYDRYDNLLFIYDGQKTTIMDLTTRKIIRECQGRHIGHNLFINGNKITDINKGFTRNRK